MATFELPYGREAIRLTVDDGHLVGVLRSGIHEYRPADDPWTIVRKSMENPIGSPRLRELAKGKRRVTVIASDHTRPVPSRVIMPQMLAEIRAGNPDAEITILVATGLHRATTRDEIAAKFGDAVASDERIVVHDCDDSSNLVDIAVSTNGGYPLDQNIYQSVKGMTAAEATVKPGGVSSCSRRRRTDTAARASTGRSATSRT